MNLLMLIKKCLRASCFILLLLVLQGGCITIRDTKNRENQIRNASKTFVEAYMAKRILQSRESTRDAYFQIYRMQDSIQRALQDVHTLQELKAASLAAELKEVENFDNDLLAYVDYAPGDDYTRQFALLLQSPDVEKSSDELWRMIHGMRTGNQLPAEYRELKALAKSRNTFLFNLQEYLSRRALTASHGYRNWAEVYRQKGMELHEAVLQDKRFTMSDLERIQTERMAEKYLALSLEYVEKSDSLLAASKQVRNPWKRGAEKQLKKHLRIQNLAQNH